MKRLALVTVSLTVLCLLPLVSLAFQEMPEFGAPKEMKKLDGMLGEWSGEFHMRENPAAPWQTSQMNLKVERILDGCAQVQTWSGNMMGMDFTGRATYTYNRQTNEWQSSWLDNLEGRQTMSTGGFEGNALVFKGEDTIQGSVFHTRDTTKMVDENHFEWMMEMSTDGGKTWFEAMKASFEKKSAM